MSESKNKQKMATLKRLCLETCIRDSTKEEKEKMFWFLFDEVNVNVILGMNVSSTLLFERVLRLFKKYLSSLDNSFNMSSIEKLFQTNHLLVFWVNGIRYCGPLYLQRSGFLYRTEEKEFELIERERDFLYRLLEQHDLC